MATVLVVSTPFDTATKYGYHWLKRFSRFAAKQGHRVIFLSTVNLQTFRDAILKYDPELVVLNGHGGSKGLEVDDNVILGVKDYDPELGKKIYQQNPEWTSGRHVALLTCNTGKELAFRLVDYGAIAVCAFRDAFIFLSEEHVSPDRDKLAVPFFISMLQYPLHLVAGNSVGYAANATRKAFNYYLDKAEAEGQKEMAKFLNHNLVNFITLGDMGAKL